MSNYPRIARKLPLLALAITLPSGLSAQEPATSPISGTFALDGNTHFISYGADTWGAGARWSDPIFNPSIELNIALGRDVSFIVGTWWDVNDNASSNIGKIQEVDVWAGFGYNYEKWGFKLLYQEWMYASDTERIVDFVASYDTFLNPSLTIHGRVDGNGPQKEGVVVVLGVQEGFTTGPVTFSFPLAIAAATDDYHGGQGGFAFISAGAAASVPVPFLPGSWSLNGGVTFYHTNDKVIPGNRSDNFLTGKLGLALSF